MSAAIDDVLNPLGPSNVPPVTAAARPKRAPPLRSVPKSEPPAPANDGAAAIDAAEQRAEEAQRKSKVKRALSRTFDRVTEEPLIEIYPGMLWAGKYSVIGGDPGLGKSVLECYIAAALSRGGKVSPYSDKEFKPRHVIICSSEDDPADTIKPRLRVAGADMSRVHDLAGMLNTEGNFEHLNLGAHLDALDEYLGDLKPAVLILDPITSFFGKIDSNSQTDVRGIVDPAMRLFRKHGTALLGIIHLNKNERASAIYRIGGSISMVGAPRCALGFLRDKTGDAKSDRLLLPIKMNLQREEPGFALRIVDKDGHPLAEWKKERCEILIDEIVGAAQQTKTQIAEDLLREVLAPGRAIPAADIEHMCRERGIGKDTRRDALHTLGAEAKRVGAEGTKNGFWTWIIPESGVKEGTAEEFDAIGTAAATRAPLDAEVSKTDWLNTEET